MPNLELERETLVGGGTTGQPARQRVGLFAKDGLGTGVFELSAISTASGAVLSTTPASVSVEATSVQTVFVGTPTLFAVVNTSAAGNTNALATLFAGPNQIGSVTVSNTVTSALNHLVSLASGTEVRTRPVSNITLNASAAYIGLASVNIGAGAAYIGLASVNVGGSLPAGTNNIGDVDVLSIAAGNTYIGSVTVTIGNPTAIALGDAMINPTVPGAGSYLLSYNGTTWERVHNEYSEADNRPVQSALYTWPLNRVFNGTNWDRWRGSASLGGDVNIKRSVTTNFAGVLSASGYSTIFVPPSGQRFFVHTAMINSKGVADGYIGSTSNPMIPFV